MNNNKIESKNSFLTPSQKAGNYILVVCAIVLAIVTALNLLCSVLPVSVTVFDTSSMKMLTLSSSSKKFLRSVEEDVTIYYLCENSEEDIRIGAFLDRVEAQNDRIKVKVIDPVLSPDFALAYTDDLLSNGSIIVASDKRSRAIDSDDLYYFYSEIFSEYLGKMSYDEYEANLLSLYNDMDLYYLLASNTSEYFNADSVITSAIEYVTSPEADDTFVSSLEQIDGIRIDETFLDVSRNTAIIWMIALVLIIPGAMVVVGIVYLSVRRRR